MVLIVGKQTLYSDPSPVEKPKTLAGYRYPTGSELCLKKRHYPTINYVAIGGVCHKTVKNKIGKYRQIGYDEIWITVPSKANT
jgi:hypothetical protein